MVRKRGSSLTTAPSLQGGRLSNPLPQPLPPNSDQVILLPMYNYESHRIYYSKSIEMLSIKSKVGKLILEFRIRYQQRWLSLGRCYCHLADIFHTTFSNAFCWMKMFEFSVQFDWSLLKGQIDSNKISIDSDEWMNIYFTEVFRLVHHFTCIYTSSWISHTSDSHKSFNIYIYISFVLPAVCASFIQGLYFWFRVFKVIIPVYQYITKFFSQIFYPGHRDPQVMVS